MGGGKQGALCENGESQFIPPVRHYCIKHCVQVAAIAELLCAQRSTIGTKKIRLSKLHLRNFGAYKIVLTSHPVI